MKASANHPEYSAAKITCSCGVIYDNASTRGDYSVEVCSACHPYYTGKQKLLDTAGRVERYNKRYAKVSTAKTADTPATDSAVPAVDSAAPAADA